MFFYQSRVGNTNIVLFANQTENQINSRSQVSGQWG